MAERIYRASTRLGQVSKQKNRASCTGAGCRTAPATIRKPVSRPAANWERELYRHLKRCGAVVYVGSTRSEESRWRFAELALAHSLDKPIPALRIYRDARQPLLDAVDGLAADKEQGYRHFRGFHMRQERALPGIRMSGPEWTVARETLTITGGSPCP
jgi:hypothetical protein